MSIDLLGLFLAISTALIAALIITFLPIFLWPSWGILALPISLAAAIFTLALGAALHTALSTNNRS